MDQCCFMLVKADKHSSYGSLRGLLILHLDDVLVAGSPTDEVFQDAVKSQRQHFNFGKWDVLTSTHSLKYCGGTILQNQYGIEVSYAEYMKRICPLTLEKGRKDDQPITEHEKSKARGLIGALQWPATQCLPMLAASMSIQAGELAGAKIKELNELNKTLRLEKPMQMSI